LQGLGTSDAERPRIDANMPAGLWPRLASTAGAIGAGHNSMRYPVRAAMFVLLQQEPVIVDLAAQPEPSRDITIDVILGMFAMAGVFLLVAAIGSALVAGGMILYKRRRDASAPSDQSPHTHTRLRI
jgi:hypothetical protein